MKIFLKTSGPVLIFFLVIALGFTLWLVPRLGAELTQWDDDSERKSATILAEALSGDMKAGQVDAVAATLSRVWADRPDWALVEAFDAEGHRFFPANASPPPPGLQKVSVRITRSKERLGALVVHFDGSLRARAVQRAIAEFELTVLVIGSGLLALGLLLHWKYVTVPIRSLGRRFKQVDASGHSPPPATVARDEIGELTQSFEQYRLELARREQALLAARSMAEEESRTNLSLRMSAEAANTAKSNFISMVSHELRTPMNAIMGMTSVIANGPLDDALRARIRTIEESSEHLLAIINQILDFSSAESGLERLDLEDFDLRELVAATLRIVESLPAARPLAISVSMAPDLPHGLRGDARRIKQVLLNLMGNAIKFTERGGVHLQVTAQPEPAGAVRLWLAVTDTGPGISAAMQQQIFEPFVKVSGFSGGTGLGLAICRRYARLMDGELTVHSTPGSGSTFTFCVRLATVPQAQAASEAQLSGPGARAVETDAAVGSSPPLRVLVAEDTPASALVVQLMLTDLGHDVRIVSDGRQAVEALSQQTFDLVLMDIQMPVMDGLAATRAIRRSGAHWAELPVVGCSAFASEPDRRNAVDAGMSDYLVKPIKRQDFQQLLARLHPSAPSDSRPGPR